MNSSDAPIAQQPGAHQLRRSNSRKILHAAWDQGPVTASELIEATGLTRATVLNQAKELVAAGWLREAADTRSAGEYSKGRPALRYELDDSSGLIAGLDAGQHRITLALADLTGAELLREEVRTDPVAGAEQRITAVIGLLQRALGSLGVQRFAALVIAVPAPVDSAGRSPEHPEGFWQRMNPNWITALEPYAQLLAVDNDANLAAVAEMCAGASGSFAALMVGERLGAGIVVDGALLRGGQGFAGEMRALSYVSGVGNALGLGYLARKEAREALENGRVSTLRREGLDARQVFRAAAAGDLLAREILESLGERLARIAAVTAGFLGLERIVLCGAMAEYLDPVLCIAHHELAKDPELAAVQLAASSLGADVALKGALANALDLVRRAAPFAK